MDKKKIITEIVWLFTLGCLLGYIMEMSCYYIKHGFFINKQGLLYGPFKPIYGLGFMVVTLFFNKIKVEKKIMIFILGILIGTTYEYSLSLFQEYVLHTSTWNYSSFNYNLNGRIYLPYCIIWGIVALIWVKLGYPFIKKQIHKIPFIITSIVGILMIINVILSGIAVYEYSNRKNNIKTSNIILKTMDKMYPNEVIERKFPKLRAKKH